MFLITIPATQKNATINQVLANMYFKEITISSAKIEVQIIHIKCRYNTKASGWVKNALSRFSLFIIKKKKNVSMSTIIIGSVGRVVLKPELE